MLVIVIAACSINKKTFFTVPRNGKIVKREGEKMEREERQIKIGKVRRKRKKENENGLKCEGEKESI